MSDLYQEMIMEEYRHPQHKGELVDPDFSWHERNSSCGDEVTVYLKLDPKHQQIADISWTGDGCAISMAAMSFVSQQVMGKSVAEVLKLNKKDLEKMMGIEEIAYGREKCLVLGLEAVQKSLKQKVAHDQSDNS